MGRQDDECRSVGKDRVARPEQPREVGLQTPRPAGRVVAEARWIEDQPVVAVAAARLTLGEPDSIVGDPADRRIRQSVELGIPPGPGDRRSAGVEMDDPGACPGGGERAPARVGEQVEDLGRSLGRPRASADRRSRTRSRPARGSSRPGRRREADLEPEASYLGRPRLLDVGHDRRPAARSAVRGLEACRGPAPGVRSAGREPTLARCRPVDQPRAEALEPAQLADIDELIAGSVVHPGILPEGDAGTGTDRHSMSYRLTSAGTTWIGGRGDMSMTGIDRRPDWRAGWPLEWPR